jgi:hypothetical protein
VNADPDEEKNGPRVGAKLASSFFQMRKLELENKNWSKGEERKFFGPVT